MFIPVHALVIAFSYLHLSFVYCGVMLFMRSKPASAEEAPVSAEAA